MKPLAEEIITRLTPAVQKIAAEMGMHLDFGPDFLRMVTEKGETATILIGVKIGKAQKMTKIVDEFGKVIYRYQGNRPDRLKTTLQPGFD